MASDARHSVELCHLSLTPDAGTAVGVEAIYHVGSVGRPDERLRPRDVHTESSLSRKAAIPRRMVHVRPGRPVFHQFSVSFVWCELERALLGRFAIRTGLRNI